MRYTVAGFEEYQTKHGSVEEEQTKTVGAPNAEYAKKVAYSMFNEGKYSSIYISYTHKQSSCFLNPYTGHDPVGKDWVSYFEE